MGHKHHHATPAPHPVAPPPPPPPAPAPAPVHVAPPPPPPVTQIANHGDVDFNLAQVKDHKNMEIVHMLDGREVDVTNETGSHVNYKMLLVLI